MAERLGRGVSHSSLVVGVLLVTFLRGSLVDAETYSFVRKWGTLGSGDGEFRFPWGLTVDKEGNVYVADFKNHRIQKFTTTGTFITKWGALGNEPGELNEPNNVAVDVDGNVYVSEWAGASVSRFTNTGTFVFRWGVPNAIGDGLGGISLTGGIAIDAGNNVYVVHAIIPEYPNSPYTFVRKWRVTGDTFDSVITLERWGTPGSGDGQFKNGDYSGARGIAVDSEGNVYVADAGNHRIQKFTNTGTFLGKWGTFGSGDGQFNSPNGLALDACGNLYVADVDNHRIQKFRSDGTFVTKWGSFGSGDGQFNVPLGVAIDVQGNVYVTELFNHRVQVFSSDTPCSPTVADTTPPVLTVPADVTAECTGNPGTPVDIGQATATDDSGEDVTITNDAPELFPFGETIVTWTATDEAGNSATAPQTVTVIDTMPPSLTPPADIIVEQANRDGTVVDIGLPTVSDICDAAPLVGHDAPPDFAFPLGETIVTWTAKDDSGNTATATQTVTVVDTTPPTIESLTVNPNKLWPPNHQMVEVQVSANVFDICDADPSFQIVGVSSNEAMDGPGDGNTDPDWEITGDLTVKLRAERSGNGGGRVYTIQVEAADDSGNVVADVVQVTVPHDQGEGKQKGRKK